MTSPLRTSPWHVASLLLAMALPACSGSSGNDTDQGNNDPDAGTPSDVFALAVSHFILDTRTADLLTIEDPRVAGNVSLDDAREIGGTTSVFGPEGGEYFVVGSSDGPTLTRYDVAADGTITPGDSVSLLDYGISSAFRRAGLVPIISDTKAYFLDDVGEQAIVWNPDTMEIVGEISLASVAPTDMSLEFGERAVMRDNRLYIPTTYYAPDDTFAPTAAVIVIDTDDDSYEGVLEDDRCGNIVHAIPGADDEIYFASGTVSAGYREVGHQPDFPAPCILRINDGEVDFDETFYVNMVELAGDRTAARLIRGAGDFYYLAIFDETLLSEPLDTTNIWAAWEAQAWRLHRFEMGSDDAPVLVSELPATNGGGRVHFTGGVSYVELSNREAGTSTLQVPQADGSFSEGITVSGTPYGLLWVR